LRQGLAKFEAGLKLMWSSCLSLLAYNLGL
jgi:hypothetical protein